MKPIRIGIIGTGGISHWHTRQLLALPDAVISAAADPSTANRERWQGTFGLESLPVYGDERRMLEEEELDAVVICSPHTLHYAQAKAALERGCHVLIEKPMTCSSEEAEELLAHSERTGKVLQVSYQRHFQPEFQYIRDAIRDNAIGKLTSVTAALYQEWQQLTAGTWRQIPALSGGGMLMDSGSHIIDVLLWTTGLTPTDVQGVFHNHGAPVEIDTFSTIRFAEGPIAGLTVVGRSPCGRETYVYAGEEGAIWYENGRITVRRIGREPETPVLPAQTTNQDKSFVDAILGRIEVQVPGSFALRVVRLTESLYKAMGYTP